TSRAWSTRGYIRDLGFGAVWITPIVDNPDQAFTGGAARRSRPDRVAARASRRTSGGAGSGRSKRR
ncbi:hypothetical protein HF319_13445, partial [Xanthomonas sp. Kuri4-1]